MCVCVRVSVCMSVSVMVVTEILPSCLLADLVLSDLEGIDKDNLDFLPDTNDVINFHRRRQFAKVIHQVQQYQSVPYNLHSIEVSSLNNCHQVETPALDAAL